jgi:hypothetical protein
LGAALCLNTVVQQTLADGTASQLRLSRPRRVDNGWKADVAGVPGPLLDINVCLCSHKGSDDPGVVVASDALRKGLVVSAVE